MYTRILLRITGFVVSTLSVLLVYIHTSFAGHTASSGTTVFTSNTPSGTTGTYTAPNGTVTNFSTNCQNCSIGGGSTGGGGGSTSTRTAETTYTPVVAPPPPAQAVCALKVDKPVVAPGATNISLVWTPAPASIAKAVGQKRELVPASTTQLASSHTSSASNQGTANTGLGWTAPITPTRYLTLTRNGTSLPAALNAATYQDTLVADFGTTYTYRLSYGTNVNTYTCSASVQVVQRLTECNDGLDNADPEDTLADAADPACHTGGDIYAPYDPSLPTETLPWPELAATATVSSKAPHVVGVPMVVRGSITNNSITRTTRSAARELMVRRSDTPAVLTNAPITWAGALFYSLISDPGIFASRGTWDKGATFTPRDEGWYEFCTVADRFNVIWELQENNNHDCVHIFVQKDVSAPVVLISKPADINPGNTTVGTAPLATPPVSFVNSPKLTALPRIVRTNATSTLSWDTGGRTQCSVSGNNGHTIPGIALTGRIDSIPIVAETKYTLSCRDDGALVHAIIKIVPEFREL